MESFLTALGPTQPLSSMDIIFSLSISFVLGLALATVYRWTHQSFSYARSFLHTMVLATIVITIMIMAIGNNMARGLGIMGAMAFVRFRTPIRDPRDIIFLFATLAGRRCLMSPSSAQSISGSPPFSSAGHHLPRGVNSKDFSASCCRRTPLRMLIYMTYSQVTHPKPRWWQCVKLYRAKSRNTPIRSAL